MEHKSYLRKLLTEMYRADKVFVKILKRSVEKAKSPLPRIKNCVRKLIKDSNGEVKEIESNLEQVKTHPKTFSRARSYQI